MRQSSPNQTARRHLIAGTAALGIAAFAVALTLEGGASTSVSDDGAAPARAAAPVEVVVAEDRVATAGSSEIADAVSSVVRTGATAATATVTGGAAATGASAAALPDTTGSGTVLAMVGVFLTLCAAAAWALLRTAAKERRTH